MALPSCYHRPATRRSPHPPPPRQPALPDAAEDGISAEVLLRQSVPSANNYSYEILNLQKRAPEGGGAAPAAAPVSQMEGTAASDSPPMVLSDMSRGLTGVLKDHVTISRMTTG